MIAAARHAVDRALEYALITLMSAMVLNVLWQVATRYVLRNPSSLTEEIARFTLIWVGLLGSAYAVGQKIHLSIDLVPAAAAGRQRAWLDLFIEACIFLFAAAVLVSGGSGLVWLTLDLGQTSAALEVPLGWVYLVLPISGLLMMFYAALHGREAWHRLRAGGDVSTRDGTV